MRSIIIWYDPNKDTFYHRIIYNTLSKYYPGYVNGYGHKVIYVIDLRTIFHKVSFKRKVIKRAIAFLHKLE